LIKKLFLIALISLSFTPVNATTTSSSLLFTPIQQTPKAAYQDQHLLLFGVEGPGVVEIYSIIGNKIKEIKVQELAILNPIWNLIQEICTSFVLLYPTRFIH